MSPDDYAKRAGANFEKNAFFESELARRVETFGSIAHVFSTYESRRAPGEKPFARGINSFQLVKEGAVVESDHHPVGRGKGFHPAPRKVPEIAVQTAASGSCADAIRVSPHPPGVCTRTLRTGAFGATG